jgi:hypothetical protein
MNVDTRRTERGHYGDDVIWRPASHKCAQNEADGPQGLLGPILRLLLVLLLPPQSDPLAKLAQHRLVLAVGLARFLLLAVVILVLVLVLVHLALGRVHRLVERRGGEDLDPFVLVVAGHGIHSHDFIDGVAVDLNSAHPGWRWRWVRASILSSYCDRINVTGGADVVQGDYSSLIDATSTMLRTRLMDNKTTTTCFRGRRC